MKNGGIGHRNREIRKGLAVLGDDFRLESEGAKR